MELPSTYQLHYMSEAKQTFQCPISDKELKWQQVRILITKMQEATSNGEFSVSYFFPKELLDNKKVLKSVAKFFRDQKYNVNHDVKDHDGGQYISIHWSDEFYRYHD